MFGQKKEKATIPYTYLLKCIPENKYYYGVRYAQGCCPADFWTTYHTSSDYVDNAIKTFGKDSFIFEIRKIFTSTSAARDWENRVLKRIRAKDRNDFYNKTDNLSISPLYGDDNPSRRKDVRTKISQALTGVKKTKEHRKNLSTSHKNGKLSGKTYEEIHGVEKARLLKENRSITSRGKRSDDAKKNNSRAQTGKKWITDGKVAIPLYPGNPMPKGFSYGRLPCTEESKKKNRESQLRRVDLNSNNYKGE